MSPKSGLAAAWFPESFSRKRQSSTGNNRETCIMWNQKSTGKQECHPRVRGLQCRPSSIHLLQTARWASCTGAVVAPSRYRDSANTRSQVPLPPGGGKVTRGSVSSNSKLFSTGCFPPSQSPFPNPQTAEFEPELQPRFRDFSDYQSLYRVPSRAVSCDFEYTL